MAGENPVASSWIPPLGVKEPMSRGKLKLYNSLTRRKDAFAPINGNSISWYICGPTVYDVAHMGHARSYVSFDILRRVLRDYFGYEILYVMNITDIDDKIIKRARQQHLFKCYAQSKPSSGQIIKDVKAANEHFAAKLLEEPMQEKKDLYKSMIDKARAAASRLDRGDDEDAEKVLEAAKEVLSDWLDRQHGDGVTDLSIFEKLSRHFEQDFNEDMQRLNVLPADVITRVSEYVPEIVAFIEKIVSRGYAYHANGSVYFDTASFRRAPNHVYGKLVPEAVADTAAVQSAMREGEGELSVDHQRVREKRNAADFALWKASKPGEPHWPSPWGAGRPGWHIECSVMATEICGRQLDIHSGGFDLRFPHHDNEIAQSEAYFDHSQWVNYFLHAGTLKIAGLKMSKSLKNFITVKEALQSYTARQLRLLFLMHDWVDTLDYSKQSMQRAIHFERLCNEFFLTVGHYLRKYFDRASSASFVKMQTKEIELSQQFTKAQVAIDNAMCNNVDTKSVLDIVRDVVGQCNAYIGHQEERGQIPCCPLLRNVAMYITRLMKVFGVVATSEEIGFADNTDGSVDKEALLMPYLTALSEFRERVRDEARRSKNTTILEDCDRLRDEVLVDLGVRLEDRKEETVIKLVDRQTLLQEREQKVRLENEKQVQKQRLTIEAEERRLKKLQMEQVEPSEMFKREGDRYSAFDERGIPTHDSTGAEISNKQRKKLVKLYEAQCQLRAKAA